MTKAEQKNARDAHQILTILAWGAVAILGINISYFVGEEVGAMWFESRGDWMQVFNAWWVGILKAMPTILIAWAIAEFAILFGRCSEGNVLTPQNVKTLKSGADSLIWAAIWSALITPNVLSWIGGEYQGLSFSFRDLALAVGMMGFVMHGLAVVFEDAIAVKAENDEFV